MGKMRLVRVRAVMLSFAAAYAAIGVPALVKLGEPVTVLWVGGMAALFFVTGRTVPDLTLPVGELPRRMPLSFGAAAVLALCLFLPAEDMHWVAIAAGCCFGNRLKASGVAGA